MRISQDLAHHHSNLPELRPISSALHISSSSGVGHALLVSLPFSKVLDGRSADCPNAGLVWDQQVGAYYQLPETFQQPMMQVLCDNSNIAVDTQPLLTVMLWTGMLMRTLIVAAAAASDLPTCDNNAFAQAYLANESLVGRLLMALQMRGRASCDNLNTGGGAACGCCALWQA